MKKYISIAVITIVCVAAVSLIPGLVISAVPGVEIAHLSVTGYIDYINSGGTIEERTKTEIKMELPVVPKEISVKTGDRVEIGQVIATLDKEETVRCISALRSAGEIPDDMWQAVLVGGSTDSRVGMSSDLIPETVVSAKAGTVTQIAMEKGAVTAANSTLAVISDLNDLIAKITVSESNIEAVSVGQQVLITGSGFKNREYTGTVESIAPTARKTQNGAVSETVVDVKVALKNTGNSVKPGFTVNAKVITSPPGEIYILPYECIMQDKDGNEYVQIISGGRAVNRIVQTGHYTPEGVQITRGLSISDPVIMQGAKQIKNNSIVRRRV